MNLMSLPKFVTLVSLCLPIISLNIQSALAADVRDFNLHNNAGVDIQEVFVSASGEDTWGADILDIDTLGAGESADVSFEDGSDNCLYDLRAVAEDGRELDARQINFCEVADYTIHE